MPSSKGRPKDYGAFLKARAAAVETAKRYFESLPIPFGCYDPGEGGRLEVAYHLPGPETHHAHYWPDTGEWKYVVPFARERGVKANRELYYQNPTRHASVSTEDFVRQFAPGSFAPGSLRFTGNLPAQLQEFYESQGHEALALAVARGEPVVSTNSPVPVAKHVELKQDDDDGTIPPRPAEGWAASNRRSNNVPDLEPEVSSGGEARAEHSDRAAGEGAADPEPEARGGGTAEANGEGRQSSGLNRGGGTGEEELGSAQTSSQEYSGGDVRTSHSRKRVAGESAADGPKGFITATYRAFATQSAYVDRLLLNVNTTVQAATRRFLCHLLATGQSRYGEERLVPVAAKLIEQELGPHNTGLVWGPLLDAELITWVWESKELKMSRQFAVKPDVRNAFLQAVPRVEDLGAARFADLISGKASKAKANPKYTTDSSGHAYPILVRKALAELWRGGCPVDLRAAEAHVDALTAVYVRTMDAWKTEARPAFGATRDALATAEGRWRADHYCLNAIKETGPEKTGEGVWLYVPRYHRDCQQSGRITEVGGLQNCSREMKHAALAGLRLSHDVRNYDLVGSQAWGLVQLFEDAGIDTDWLKTYVSSDKGTYAERAFGDRSPETVDLWKACLFALFMGAVMPRSVADVPKHVLDADGLARKPMEIAKGIRDRFGGGDPTVEAKAKLKSFRAVVQPFLAARDAWHGQLEARSTDDNTFAKWGKGGRYVSNAAGMTFRVDDKSGFPLRSKLAAHLLQGLEASFIHRLTALGQDHGFSAVNNQHDGLLTVGAVPAAAVDLAKAGSGLRYATLVEKPYASGLIVLGLGN